MILCPKSPRNHCQPYVSCSKPLKNLVLFISQAKIRWSLSWIMKWITLEMWGFSLITLMSPAFVILTQLSKARICSLPLTLKAILIKVSSVRWRPNRLSTMMLSHIKTSLAIASLKYLHTWFIILIRAHIMEGKLNQGTVLGEVLLRIPFFLAFVV